jgi:hypothetical protein
MMSGTTTEIRQLHIWSSPDGMCEQMIDRSQGQARNGQMTNDWLTRCFWSRNAVIGTAMEQIDGRG